MPATAGVIRDLVRYLPTAAMRPHDTSQGCGASVGQGMRTPFTTHMLCRSMKLNLSPMAALRAVALATLLVGPVAQASFKKGGKKKMPKNDPDPLVCELENITIGLALDTSGSIDGDRNMGEFQTLTDAVRCPDTTDCAYIRAGAGDLCEPALFRVSSHLTRGSRTLTALLCLQAAMFIRDVSTPDNDILWFINFFDSGIVRSSDVAMNTNDQQALFVEEPREAQGGTNIAAALMQQTSMLGADAGALRPIRRHVAVLCANAVVRGTYIAPARPAESRGPARGHGGALVQHCACATLQNCTGSACLQLLGPLQKRGKARELPAPTASMRMQGTGAPS